MHYDRSRKHSGGAVKAPLQGKEPAPRMFIRPPSRTACCVQGCTAPHHAKGYCKSHYSQLRRRGQIEGTSARRSSLCEIAGCERPIARNKRCEKHAKALSQPSAPLRLTRSQRLAEIRRRHELMRTEIERIKQSFDSDGDDE